MINTQARAVFEQVRDDFVSETATGLYVKNTTVWTPWLRSLAGLRADWVDMDVDAQLTPQNSGTAYGQKLSPKLSLIFGPWAEAEFFQLQRTGRRTARDQLEEGHHGGRPEAAYRQGGDLGNPNHGSTLLSKWVMAQHPSACKSGV